MPRIKQINRVSSTGPRPGRLTGTSRLASAMTRLIRWDLIAQQYDQMISTRPRSALGNSRARRRSCVGSPGAASHPTYQAMLELSAAPRRPSSRPATIAYQGAAAGEINAGST
ncbi:transposase [Pseudonocardia sp. MCCB 268]|nr:transposase [Pseudonocardia cytotoxica]